MRHSAIAPTPMTLPEAVNSDLERYEGMLVTFPQTLTASQNYFQGRYGADHPLVRWPHVQPDQRQRPGRHGGAERRAA